MKKIIVFLPVMFFFTQVFAQNPVTWNYSAKKIADKTYEIHFTATIEEPWHIYSQSVPEGGPIPTAISFSKNPLVKISGKVKEVGKLVEKYEEVFKIKVKYYSKKVDFVQVVTLRQVQGDKPVKTTANGAIEYMVCTNEECLPPQNVNFSVNLN